MSSCEGHRGTVGDGGNSWSIGTSRSVAVVVGVDRSAIGSDALPASTVVAIGVMCTGGVVGCGDGLYLHDEGTIGVVDSTTCPCCRKSVSIEGPQSGFMDDLQTVPGSFNDVSPAAHTPTFSCIGVCGYCP